MIFTSSSVTSFQDYRLQEKSIQNTILAAGLCSVRILTFLPSIRDSQLSWSESRTHKQQKERKRGERKKAHFSNALGAGLGTTLSSQRQVECVVKLPTFSSCFCNGRSYWVHKKEVPDLADDFFSLKYHLHLLFMCFKQLGLEVSSYLTGWFKEVATSL